jgi:hypothetical protein
MTTFCNAFYESYLSTGWTVPDTAAARRTSGFEAARKGQRLGLQTNLIIKFFSNLISLEKPLLKVRK